MFLFFLCFQTYYSYVETVQELLEETRTLTLQGAFDGYGVASEYIPLGSKQYQYYQFNTDISYFLGSMRNESNSELFYFYYLEILSSKSKVVHHVLFKQDSIWKDYIQEYDIKSYEGIWVDHQFYYDDEKQYLVIYIRQYDNMKKYETEYISLRTGTFSFQIGGSFQGLNPLSGEILNLNIFSGALNAIISEQKYELLTIVNYFLKTLCSDIFKLLDENIKISSSSQFQIFQLKERNYFYYKLSFWVIIEDDKFDSEQDQQVNIFRISANRFTVDFQATGSNSFVMKYIYSSSKQEWKITIQHYSYEVPIILQFNNYNDPYSRKDEILITNQQCLFNWQYIVVEYDQNLLNFKFDNLLSGCQYFRNYENVYQFSNIFYKLFFGGSIVDSNTLGLQIATVSFYDCNQDQNICHYSCETCFGPLRNQCLTCSSENNRIYNENFNTCSCQLWFNEYNQTSCLFFPQEYDQTQISFSLNSIENFENNFYQKCNFGEFIFEGNCYKCPSASQDKFIVCVECLQNPLRWVYENPTCSQIYYKDEILSSNYLQMRINDSKTNIEFLFEFDELVQCFGCYLCNQGEVDCQLSKYYHLNQKTYIKCKKTYTFIDGECQKVVINNKLNECSFNCIYCNDSNFCLQCKTDNRYFINIHGQCQICQISDCLQCFQYNQQNMEENSIFNQTDNLDQQNDDYFIGCLQCEDQFYYSFQTGQCHKQNQATDCQFYENEQGNQICFSSSIFQNQLQQIEECESYFPNCRVCIHKRNNLLACVLCDYGYYINIVNGSCKNCNSNGKQAISECYIDSQYEDKYKLELIGVYQTLIQNFYDINYLYNQLSKFTVKNCIEQYSIDKTQESCSMNCQNCEDCQLIDDQFQCLKCSGQDDLGNIYYSQINGICYKCPLMCQFCMPIDIEQIQVYNPYYVYDELDPPLKCLENYDQNQTYIDFQSGQLYPIDINKKSYFSLKIFPNLDSILTDIKNSPNLILPSNFFSQSQTYIRKFYTVIDIQVYQYNAGVNGNIKIINATKFICDGCLNSSFENNIYQITSVYGTEINFYNNYQNKEEITNVIIYQIEQIIDLKIENFILFESTFFEYTFVQVQSFQRKGDLTLKNLGFLKTNFTDSIFLQLYSKQNNTILIEDLSFINCSFTNFTFISLNSTQNQSFEMMNLIIHNCSFENSQLFSFSLRSSKFIFQNISISYCTFQSSYLIQSSGLFNFYDISLSNILLNNSILFLCQFQLYSQKNLVLNLSCNKIKIYSSTLLKFIPNQIHNNAQIVLSQINLQYIFLIESYLFETQQGLLTILNVTVTNQFMFQLLRANNCKSIIIMNFYILDDVAQNFENTDTNYNPLIIINNFNSLVIQKFHVQNKVRLKNQLFYIISDSTFQANISFNALILEEIVYIISYSNNYNFIYIQLENALMIEIKDCQLNSIQFNYQTIEIEEQIMMLALIFLSSQEAIVVCQNLTVKNVSINNSSQSIFRIMSDQIIFNQIIATNINSNSNIVTNSASGFALLLAQTLQVLNSQFTNLRSVNYGFIFIQLKQDGSVLIKESLFDNSVAFNSLLYQLPIFGGAFTIDAQFSKLTLIIQYVTVQNFQVQKSSGFIYLLPSFETNQIQITYLTLLNVYQSDASFISFNFPQYSKNNIVVMKNVLFKNQYSKILDAIQQSSIQDYNSSYGMLITNANLKIFNLSVVGYINEPVLNVKNCSAIKINNVQIQEISISRRIQYLISFENSNLILKNLLIFNISTELQLQTIINLDTSINQYRMENSKFKRINCSFCNKTMIYINSIFDLHLLNFLFYGNQCGQNSCLLIQNSSVKLQQSQFISNYGKEQGIMVIQESTVKLKQLIFKNNVIFGYSGAIYSFRTIFSFNQSFIINNSATYAGGFYQTQEKLQSSEIKQLCFFENNSTLGVKNIWELPDFLCFSMYDMIIQTKREIYSDIILDEPKYLLNSKQQRLNQTVFKVPSGQQVSEFKIFDKTIMKYTQANISLSLIPFTQLGERIVDSTLQSCSIKQILVDDAKNYSIVEILNKNQDWNITETSLDQTTLSFQLGKLVYHLNPYNKNQQYILTATQCDFMDDNYYFIFKVKTLKCQIGEYYRNEECLKCDYEKGFYSVEINSTSCQKMDPELIKSISLSSIELQQGYWRLSYHQNIIEKCQNYACLGGEQVSFKSCKIGYLGAICGACDLYNIRGESQYITTLDYECEKKEQKVELILLLFIEMLGLFTVSYIISNLKYQMHLLYKNFKQQTIHYRILFKCQLDQSNTILKSFLNFTQILYPILPKSFQFFNISLLIWPFGYSSKIVEYFIQFFSDQFGVEIIYLELLGAILLPFVQIAFLGFILAGLRKIIFQKSIYLFYIKISFNFLLVYQLPFIIQKLSMMTSSSNLANIDWIEANLSYQFYTKQHIQWLIFFILPGFLIFFMILPFYYYSCISVQNNIAQTYPTQGIFGYFSSDYQNQFYYWEIVVLQAKLFIIVIHFFLNNELLIQKRILTIIILFSLYIFTAKFKPFIKMNQTNLEKNSIMICLFCTCISVAQLTLDNTFPFIICEIILDILIFFALLKYLYIFLLLLCKINFECIQNLKSKFKKTFPNFEFYFPFLRKYLRSNVQNKTYIFNRFQTLKYQLKHQKQLNLKSMRSSINLMHDEASGFMISQLQRSINPASVLMSPV